MSLMVCLEIIMYTSCVHISAVVYRHLEHCVFVAEFRLTCMMKESAWRRTRLQKTWSMECCTGSICSDRRVAWLGEPPTTGMSWTWEHTSFIEHLLLLSTFILPNNNNNNNNNLPHLSLEVITLYVKPDIQYIQVYKSCTVICTCTGPDTTLLPVLVIRV